MCPKRVPHNHISVQSVMSPWGPLHVPPLALFSAGNFLDADSIRKMRAKLMSTELGP